MLQLSVVICSLLFSFAAQAEVYKWVDANGKTHFGDKVPESAKVETLNLPNTLVQTSSMLMLVQKKSNNDNKSSSTPSMKIAL